MATRRTCAPSTLPGSVATPKRPPMPFRIGCSTPRRWSAPLTSARTSCARCVRWAPTCRLCRCRRESRFRLGVCWRSCFGEGPGKRADGTKACVPSREATGVATSKVGQYSPLRAQREEGAWGGVPMTQSAPLDPRFFRRDDESPDARFYTEPRLTVHIDDGAIAAATTVYRELLPAGGAVLDLMSSWRSHLPQDV